MQDLLNWGRDRLMAEHMAQDLHMYEQALSNWANGVDTNMTDAEFDKLEQKVKPAIGVPGDAKLPTRMWSIGKDNANKLANHFQCIAQLKIDGVALLLHYRSGYFVDAFTRGDGVIGQCVSHHAKYMDFPKSISTERGLDTFIIGEAYLERETASILGFKNPRNGVAGLLNRKDCSPENAKHIKLFAFNVIGEYSELAQMKVLKKWGFTLPQTYTNISVAVFSSSRDRTSLSFDIDGLVIKVNDVNAKKRLGYTDHHPRFYSAYKFAAANNTTKITKIEWQIGRTGLLIPVAHLEPLDLAGSTIRKATLHSYNNVADRKVAPGDTVLIKKAGDIIPYVADVTERGGYEFEVLPVDCPGCQKALRKEGAHIFCYNWFCEEQRVQSFEYACKTIGVKGIGPKAAASVIHSTESKSLAEAFELALITNTGRFPPTVPMWKAIQMLGEEGIGKAKAKAEAINGITIHKYLSKTDADLLMELLRIK